MADNSGTPDCRAVESKYRQQLAVEHRHRLLAEYEQFAKHEPPSAANVLTWICGRGPPVDDARWLADRWGVSAATVRSCDIKDLRMAASWNNWDIVEWLIEDFELEREVVIGSDNPLFIVACKRGHLDKARWLAELLDLTPAEVRMDCDLALRTACGGGHAHVAEWLVATYDMTAENARASALAALTEACTGGHVDLAKWLVSTFDLAGAMDTAQLLQAVCAAPYAYVAVLDWLASCGLTSAEWREALVAVIERGHSLAANWLIRTFRLAAADVRAADNEPLRLACTKGYLETAKVLAATGLTADDARANDNEMLRLACAHNHKNIAVWLVETFGLTAADVRAGVVAAHVNRQYALGDWLADRYSAHLPAGKARTVGHQ